MRLVQIEKLFVLVASAQPERIAIANFACRSKLSVLIQKGLDLVVVNAPCAQSGSQVGGFEVGPEDVVFENVPVRACGFPLAALGSGIGFQKCGAL